MEKGGWVYIMATRYHGGMYVGVTSDLIRRIHQHREGRGSIHVADFNKKRLVYAEPHEEIEPAIAREKLIKKCDGNGNLHSSRQTTRIGAICGRSGFRRMVC